MEGDTAAAPPFVFGYPPSAAGSRASESSDSNADAVDDDDAVYDPTRPPSGLIETDEEILMERHLLRTQLQAAETKLREKSDEQYFNSVRLRERDAKIKALETQLKKQETKHAAALQQLGDLQRTCLAQYSQNLELEYVVRRQSAAKQGPEPSEPGGSEKFLKQKDLALTLRKQKANLARRNQRLREQLEAREANMMFYEDPAVSAGVCCGPVFTTFLRGAFLHGSMTTT
ncbi:hypothetical protein DIPPA_30702 [Diplonema papillatum]|nr:hypothetical protein DIPPA_30702 [Diplonema papillatum]